MGSIHDFASMKASNTMKRKAEVQKPTGVSPLVQSEESGSELLQAPRNETHRACLFLHRKGSSTRVHGIKICCVCKALSVS